MAESKPISNTAQDPTFTAGAFELSHASAANSTDVPTAAAIAAPPHVGQYAILGELGRGGMGIVYRAEDPHLKRDVALKIMLPQFAKNKTAKARFVREARAQAKVEHEHVAVIHQVAEHDGLPYLVMPLLKGMTLHTALRANPRPPLPEVIRIGREMAEGLAAAHESGLVHRDIKPANIWLEGKKLRVRLLDFGLARIAVDADATENDNGPVTREGALIGTPSYMSPEQARGLQVDGRTDLWSLGVILYQMTTGELPFNGTSTIGILTSVSLDHPPSPMERNPAIPHQLSDLVMRLLAKDPAQRPATAEGLAEELRVIETGLAGMARLVSLDAATPLAQHAAGPDPFAEIDATEPSGVAKPVERRESSGQQRSKLWLYVGAGVAALTLIAVVVAAASKRDRKPVDVVHEDPPKPTPVKPKDKEKDKDKDKDKKDPHPLPLGTDFREIHGASLTGLQNWMKEIHPKFRPIVLSARAGTLESTFDAVAIPDNREWEFTTSLQGTEQDVFNDHRRRGFVPRLRVPYHVERLPGLCEVWVKDPPAPWEAWNLARIRLEEKLKEELAADFMPSHLAAIVLREQFFGAMFLTRANTQKWEAGIDLQLNDLTKRVQDCRTRGWRPKSITAVHDPNRVRFSAVFCENQPPSNWDLQTGLGTAEYERALIDRREKRQRPSAVASYVVDGKVSYVVLWEEVTDHDAERRAAQLLKPFATTITVRMGWNLTTIARADPLPEAGFEVVGLHFGEGKHPRDFVGQTLLPAVAELRALTNINGLHLPMLPADLNRLASGSAAETITDLVLPECDITLASLEQLRKFRNLSSIGLNARMADDDLLAKLKDFPKLTGLTLKGLDARGKAGDRGVEAITSLPLRSLGFTASDLSASHYRDIADMPNLTNLDLDSSTTDDGCVADLATCPKLQTLNLSGTKVTEKSLASVAKIASLQVVELRRIRITERALSQLMRSRPDLRIYHDNGVVEPKKP